MYLTHSWLWSETGADTVAPESGGTCGATRESQVRIRGTGPRMEGSCHSVSEHLGMLVSLLIAMIQHLRTNSSKGGGLADAARVRAGTSWQQDYRLAEPASTAREQRPGRDVEL